MQAIVKTPIHFNGQYYASGSTIDFEDKDYAALALYVDVLGATSQGLADSPQAESVDEVVEPQTTEVVEAEAEPEPVEVKTEDKPKRKRA